ncbi:hypothetical protein SPBR_01432 [Sporothrix brasiliensis 5110]|uniref:5'-Nucleotidase C-terminal domain-containing protein n=1 Tax=Sporothrix brasiliensis 5110 TaxID=1398154 RepID=A0A0C2IW12_9PEZI|nr:uncharacterized protein SPBR_01432 [Sporothrix brasiliensis 5110]KIH90985.1 hypothetical protein SPBR_01432 [Sporothrix brasiliensis 5110]
MRAISSSSDGTEFPTFTPDHSIDSLPNLRILHFNDVYHLDPSSAEPVGGAARFQTAVNEYRSSKRYIGQPDLITLFSGDAFNPSLESSVTKGSHMVPILNQLATTCACVGNHDLDFGVKQFEYLAGKSKLKQSLEKAIGWTAAPLDARFTTVRVKESNLGNFVCDIMRLHYEADCAIMASGTIRGDQIYPPGPVRVKDITDCFPFEDPVVVLRVTGQAILDALENGVSLYPALEGRFAQVSNITYEFDPLKPPGSRITKWELGGAPADLQKLYVLCTRGYMARGKDGFASLLAKSEGGTAEEIVDEESGILISMMLRQYFMALKVLDQWTHWSLPMEHHWGRVVSKVDHHHPHLQPGSTTSLLIAEPIARQKDFRGRSLSPDNDAGWRDWTAARLRQRRCSAVPFNERVVDDATPAQNTEEMRRIDRQMQIMRRVARKWCRLAGVPSRLGDTLTELEYEADWTKAIAPRVEGRIRVVCEVGEGK